MGQTQSCLGRWLLHVICATTIKHQAVSMAWCVCCHGLFWRVRFCCGSVGPLLCVSAANSTQHCPYAERDCVSITASDFRALTCRGPDLGLGPEKVRREIQLQARLNHVNIVELKQVCGRPWKLGMAGKGTHNQQTQCLSPHMTVCLSPHMMTV